MCSLSERSLHCCSRNHVIIRDQTERTAIKARAHDPAKFVKSHFVAVEQVHRQKQRLNDGPRVVELIKKASPTKPLQKLMHGGRLVVIRPNREPAQVFQDLKAIPFVDELWKNHEF